jgi:hypothetical protein
VTETLEPGWSAGVIFSGDDEELAMLERCLDGLLAQPEVVADGGEILVCGPPRNLDFLTRFPKVRYVEYEAETRPRFMIAAKKNFLVRALRNPRAAVMHVRIVLEPGCLAAMPHEFDVITPAVAYEHDGRRVRYLDYRILDFADPRRVPSTGLTLMIENPQRYLAKLHRGQPYIDGGLFIARRAVFETTALNEALAWGEAEDIEWCNRLYHAGYLIDMEPAANATSQTFKMHKSSLEQSPLIRQRHILARMRFLTRGWIRHRVGLITGER